VGESGQVRPKSYSFALEAIKATRQVQAGQREYVLTGQFLRAATSIGANIEEANAAQTKRDFIAKMAVASKEAREAHYWLRLLTDAEYLAEDTGKQLQSSALELVRMLTAIVKSAQTRERRR
jgi:four helix bundle protein